MLKEKLTVINSQRAVNLILENSIALEKRKTDLHKWEPLVRKLAHLTPKGVEFYWDGGSYFTYEIPFKDKSRLGRLLNQLEKYFNIRFDIETDYTFLSLWVTRYDSGVPKPFRELLPEGIKVRIQAETDEIKTYYRKYISNRYADKFKDKCFSVGRVRCISRPQVCGDQARLAFETNLI